MAALHDSIVSLDSGHTWFSWPPAAWDSSTSQLVFADIRADGALAEYGLKTKTGYDLYLHGALGTAAEIDDHDNPSVCVLNTGKYLAAYSGHPSTTKSVRSTNAGDVRTQDAPVTVNSGTDCSYACLFQTTDDNHTVFLFYRNAAAGVDPGLWFYKLSTDGGATWGSEQNFIQHQAAGGRPYPNFAWNGARRIYFMACRDGDFGLADCSIGAGYVEISQNGATVTVNKLDGTGVSVPVKPSDLTALHDGSVNFAWGYETKYCADGTVVFNYCVFTAGGSDLTDHTAVQKRWDGATLTGPSTITQIGDGSHDDVTWNGTTSTSPSYMSGWSTDPQDKNKIYISKKYGTQDFRLELWTHTGTFGGGGSWTKTSDISGNTGTVNFRPFALDCGGTTKVLWLEGTYTGYTAFTLKRRMYPSPTWKKAKPTTATWTSGYAPSGIQAYHLINEGSGNILDKTGNGYTATAVGTPTWNAGGASDFGAYVSGLSTSNYFTTNSLAAAWTASRPRWIAMLYKTTSTSTTAEFDAAFGRSSDNNPIVALRTNNGDAHDIGAFIRDDAGNNGAMTINAAGANGGWQNDGEFHVLMYSETASNARITRIDGVNGQSNSTSIGTTTLDRGAIGCLVRSGPEQASSRQQHAILVGWGGAPDRCWLAMDLLRGQFSGTFDPDAGGSTRESFFYRLLNP